MAGRRRLKELFQKYDVSCDGVLSEEEMSALFASLGLAKEDSRKMFEAADANKDGMVQINEFLDWLMGQNQRSNVNKTPAVWNSRSATPRTVWTSATL